MVVYRISTGIFSLYDDMGHWWGYTQDGEVFIVVSEDSDFTVVLLSDGTLKNAYTGTLEGFSCLILK